MSDTSTVGPKASLTPRLITNNPKRSKLFSFSIPGLGRFGFTRDPGEADFFSTALYRTRLGARFFSPEGDLLGEYEYGAGKVTNAGVLALAQDGLNLKFGKAKESFAVLPNLLYHAWGSSNTAAATTDIKLGSLKKPTETNGVKGTNTLTASGTGAPKLVSKAKIKAESSFEVVEWGIHTAELLSATTGSPLTAETATTATTTGTALTASSEEAKGETLKLLVPSENSASEAKSGWGLITSNTTSVANVPAWYTIEAGGAYTPKATSAYTIKPVMFDHRVISPISVESGNEIEFIWELELPSGG